MELAGIFQPSRKRIEARGDTIMNRFKWVIFAVAVAFPALSVLAQINQSSAQVTVTGFITDTLSGKRGANELHAEAAKRNVAAGMAKYALYDEATMKLYILEPQDLASAHLDKRVTVTGAMYLQPMQHAGQHVNPTTGQVEDFHTVRQDSTTPIAGVLTNCTIAVTPYTTPKPK
jgi:hypothetical protein